MVLYNKYDKETLRKKLEAENFRRITLSFYRYVIIAEPQMYRDELYLKMDRLGILGRVYVAREGINAQINVPAHHFDDFKALLEDDPHLKGMPLKIAVEDDGRSFLKLIVRTRKKIVADGLEDDSFDVTNVGKHLSAREFNEAMEVPGTVVIDMRNYYESEVGHFEGAICPEVDTFREELEKTVEMVADKKDQKILLYCTGGIRCEKASAWFRHHGFNDVNQLHGGIIQYAREVREQGLKSRFIGKNFVFDERLGERITDDVISQCHQCGAPCDDHVNCANDECHLLFIQCKDCAEQFDGCCTPACQEIYHLPLEEQRLRRKGRKKSDTLAVYRSRLRPDLRQILSAAREGSLKKV
ncbi:MAG: rhodanese-related sulfurtransferase [Bacteroidia bacterium]|nr:rhodanese-related sulfurtransferase [Bacteroidia bacterium]